MVEPVDPSNSFNGMGGTETVGREYFCTTCDSIKQLEEPQSRSVTKGFSGILVHVKFNTKEFFERVEEMAFKVGMQARLPQSLGCVVPRFLIIFFDSVAMEYLALVSALVLVVQGLMVEEFVNLDLGH